MKLIFCLQINRKGFFKLTISFYVCVAIILGMCGQTCPSYPNNTFAIHLQYLKENVKDKVNFLPIDKQQRFLQIDDIILGVCVARHAQVTQNNTFAIPSQYLKENVNNKVDFLLADKQQRFLLIDNISLGVCGQACPN